LIWIGVIREREKGEISGENDRHTDKWHPLGFISLTEDLQKYVTGHDLVFLPANAIFTSSELGICQHMLAPSRFFHTYQHAGRV
jgi:hypothetical protein